MRIVVLDEVDFSPQQAATLEKLGDVTWHRDNPRSDDETIDRLKSHDIAVLGWTSVSDDVLAQCPRLSMISIWATGYNYVDVEAARARGISVCNVPDYAARSVAEYTIGLMLACTRKIVIADRQLRGGSESWQPYKGFDLRGRRLGVIGAGSIGMTVCELARGLGMEVVVTTASSNEARAQKLADMDIEVLPLDQLLGVSDIVSLHVPLNNGTRHLLGEREFQLMRPTSVLINTTRADVINQGALVSALGDGRIAAAGLDEAHLPDTVLSAMEQVVITPHIAFYSEDALVRKGDICILNIDNFAQGHPTNLVN